MQSRFPSSPGDPSLRPQRLPVNPRRHKVAPQHRKRVSKACNACNVRRIKCSGEQPCSKCLQHSRECDYPVPEFDKNELKRENERLQRRLAALEEFVQDRIQVENAHEAADFLHRLDQDRRTARSSISQPRSGPSEIDETEVEAEAEADEIPAGHLRDGDGSLRYLGETSGASFLDSLKLFMKNELVPRSYVSGAAAEFLNSIGQYQTFDSRPLPNPDGVDPFWLPAPEAMGLMLKELRYFIQDGNGEYSSGGLYYWGNLSTLPASPASSSSVNALTTPDRLGNLAFYHVCFALAATISDRDTEKHTGVAYFTRARTLIGNPLDTVQFTVDDVPVLTLMGFYLIELNRRDTAYIYVSMAIHVGIIQGMFTSYVNEAQTRTVWTLYILDRWLSALMGRPPIIAVEAIKIPPPNDCFDLPPCAGLRAHVELAHISNFIVCETFKIAAKQDQPGYTMKNIDKALGELQAWKTRLPTELRLSQDQAEFDPACGTLHMAQNQLIVLTMRPLFLDAVKNAVNNRSIGGYWSLQQHPQAEYLYACLNAAQENLVIAQRIIAIRKLLQAGLHFVYNAAVILLLDRILNGTQSQHPAENLHGPEIDFAIEVFEKESKTGTHYPRDCCKVLQDLKALVAGYLYQVYTPSTFLPENGDNVRALQKAKIPYHAPKDPSLATQRDEAQLRDSSLSLRLSHQGGNDTHQF